MNFKWPNARDWIGLGSFALTVMVLWMMKTDRALREDEFFQTIATAIITMGFLGGPVSWAYAATKGGGEAAESSARIAEKAAEATVKAASGPSGTRNDPLVIEGAPDGSQPVATHSVDSPEN